MALRTPDTPIAYTAVHDLALPDGSVYTFVHGAAIASEQNGARALSDRS
ncbi:hypothetical protein [Micromonospora peucetia]|uniref:Uncharacterized protein n=1 Tax=Micromonospora peucetia TaxID=47871 RepID=A0A1C6TYJ2_9ACTN|nr:hypothetical protein [Micromonospora peucetia]WSA33141.1 hypothetical protein OIE14_03430 [Micromonospora peucetia]SCL46902.1 hypothetical protein GA0070608_0133 [Micromonospora peucetia]